ncbi:MAG: hypothetical protein IJL26_09480, partial [Clostridia bacterium]|nr:hypothetical protein [Clostridia bacterium]
RSAAEPDASVFAERTHGDDENRGVFLSASKPSYPADAALLERAFTENSAALAERGAVSRSAEQAALAARFSVFDDAPQVLLSGGERCETAVSPASVRAGNFSWDVGTGSARVGKVSDAEERRSATAQTAPFTPRAETVCRGAAFGNPSAAALHRYGTERSGALPDARTELSAFGDFLYDDGEDREAAGTAVLLRGAVGAFSPLAVRRRDGAERCNAESLAAEESSDASNAAPESFDGYMSDFISDLRAALTASPELTYGT